MRWCFFLFAVLRGCEGVVCCGFDVFLELGCLLSNLRFALLCAGGRVLTLFCCGPGKVDDVMRLFLLAGRFSLWPERARYVVLMPYGELSF